MSQKDLTIQVQVMCRLEMFLTFLSVINLIDMATPADDFQTTVKKVSRGRRYLSFLHAGRDDYWKECQIIWGIA